MPSFRVEPVTLEHHAASISRLDSFAVLATAVTDRRSRLAPLSTTSSAVDALEQRLFERLIQLSALTDAIGLATRAAAERYSTLESSIAAASADDVHPDFVE